MGILSGDIGKLRATIDRQWQEAVGATKAALQLATPVDTGYAAGMWMVEPHDDYFVSVVNRVVYIEALEAGHSAQAPDGILALAVPMIDASLTEIFR